MSKKDPLLSLPGCVSRCDVCGHEPVDTWVLGFGCNKCKGADAVLAAFQRDPHGTTFNTKGGKS